MPTYEYECTKCAHHFELVQSMTDKPRSRCPECRGKVIRLISGGVGISFKGSGYYVNDSRSTSSGSKCDGCPAAKDSDA
jgi:putative FmdB family regulatory protein